MQKLLNEFYNHVMDKGTGMIRETDILQFIESKSPLVELDLHNLIHLTKSDMTALVSDKMEQLDEGWIDEVDLFIYAKKLEYVSSELLKAVKDKVDASKLVGGYDKYNVHLEARNSAGSWDFSNCNYAKLDEAKLIASQAAEKVKEQQEFLKGLKEPIELLDSDTSEVVKVFPPIKGGKLGPVATLK